MPIPPFKIAAVQCNPRLGDVDANLAMYGERVGAARAAGAELIVFPELSLTGYFLKDMVSTVALRHDAAELARVAELSRGCAVVCGFVEEAADFRFYNSAAYFEDGKLLHVHRKAYLPTYGLFDEGRYLARGDQIRAFDSRFGRAAMLVCEDLWHPSTVLVAALDGASFVICPSNSPLRGIDDAHQQDDNARYWELINSAWAQTYGMFIVYANRVGFEDGVGFWGGSEIIAPNGERLAKGKYYEEDLIVAEVNLKEARRARLASPLLRDENLDLTINELLRIRGRSLATAETGEVAPAAKAPAPVRRRAAKRLHPGKSSSHRKKPRKLTPVRKRKR